MDDAGEKSEVEKDESREMWEGRLDIPIKGASTHFLRVPRGTR